MPMLSHIHPVPVNTSSRPLPACLDQRRDRLDTGKYHDPEYLVRSI